MAVHRETGTRVRDRSEVVSEIKITERGWAGHFICSHLCMFRRNTLVEYGDKAIVVSTVGHMRNAKNREVEEIGANRYYETCVFKARNINGYMDADVTEELYEYEDAICADSVDHLIKTRPFVDIDANLMHDTVVNVVGIALREGRI